jgi:hypothetical protein
VSSLRLFGVTTVDGGGDGEHHPPLAPGTSLVTFRELAAVVAETPYGRPALADGDVAAYRSVVECVFQQRALLPAPPGVVFRARAALERWLEIHFVTLTDALAYVEGRVAGRVHVTRATPRLTPGATPAVVEGQTEEVPINVDAVASESFRVLRRHAAASVTLKPYPQTAGGGGAGVSAVASFLVDRERWGAFEAAVAEEGRRDPELQFRLTGPWPPYDFVRMQFGR